MSHTNLPLEDHTAHCRLVVFFGSFSLRRTYTGSDNLPDRSCPCSTTTNVNIGPFTVSGRPVTLKIHKIFYSVIINKLSQQTAWGQRVKKCILMHISDYSQKQSQEWFRQKSASNDFEYNKDFKHKSAVWWCINIIFIALQTN